MTNLALKEHRMRHPVRRMSGLLSAALGVLAMSCSSPERTAGIINPDADEESEREGHEPTTEAGKAYEWRRLAWMDERGQIAPGAMHAALRQRESNMAAWAGSSRIAGIAPSRWTSRGPNNIGGRTRTLIIHPTQTNRLWAGAVGGGVWSSGDGGLTWSPAADHLANLSVVSMAIAPSNPNIIYAGTGETWGSGDGVYGLGVCKSTDGGATWNFLNSTKSWSNNDVMCVAVSPTNANVVLAMKFYQGIYRTANGGSSWSLRRFAQAGVWAAFHPTDASKCVASVADYDQSTQQWYHHTLFSTDGGLSWNDAIGLDYKPGTYSRIVLAYARSNPNIVYATSAYDRKIFKSLDGGQSYVPVTAGTLETDWYRSPLWVDPTNPDVVLSGMGHVMRSTDGGVTFTQISNGYINTVDPHPDIHAIFSDPGFNGTTNKRVYVCTDGGVYKTEDVYAADQGVGWARLEQTYRTTQFYAAVGDGPTGKIYGGTQDNGHLLLQNGSDTATIPFGGDGGFCAIDWNYPNVLYGEFIYLQIHRSKNGGASAGYITSGLSDAGTAANFIAPFILDPNNSNTMLAGGASLWRSKNVRTAVVSPTWSRIRDAGSSFISAIAVAPGNSDIIWVAQNDGRIDTSLNGTATTPTWSVIDDNGATRNPLPDRYCTRIVVDPLDHGTVYAAFGGFSPDNLWRTTDGGATWQDITGAGPTGLPDAPIRGVALHPDRRGWIYVGTEVGVFASADGGVTWATNNEGPNVASVDELNFMHASTVLLSATHGRGLWTSPTDMCAADFNGDGYLNGNDFDAFAAAFEAGEPAADINGDRYVNGNDFDLFAEHFELGC